MERAARRPQVWLLAVISVPLLALAFNVIAAQPQPDPLIPEDEFIRLRAAPVSDPPDGARLFVGNCATCHGNEKVGRGNADAYRRVILNGISRGDDGSDVVMPGFADLLSDEEIETLINYLVRQVGSTTSTPTPP